MAKKDASTHWVGFDLGGTKMLAVLFNDQFKVVDRNKKKTRPSEGADRGLERVAENQGFIEEAREPWYSVIPDYVFPGIANEGAATILAGLVGTLLMFVLMVGLSRAIKGRAT